MEATAKEPATQPTYNCVVGTVLCAVKEKTRGRRRQVAETDAVIEDGYYLFSDRVGDDMQYSSILSLLEGPLV